LKEIKKNPTTHETMVQNSNVPGVGRMASGVDGTGGQARDAGFLL